MRKPQNRDIRGSRNPNWKGGKVNEAFFRCFDAPGVTWTETGIESPVLAHQDNALIGIVMPVRHIWQDDKQIYSATDSEVFLPFACKANGYYQADNPRLMREIAALQSELDEAEEAVELARDKAVRLERKINQKKRSIRSGG
jgi:hypothetical protein